MQFSVPSNRTYQIVAVSALILYVNNIIYIQMSTSRFSVPTDTQDECSKFLSDKETSEKLAFNESLHHGQMNDLFNEGFDMRAHVCIASVSYGRPVLLNCTLLSVIGHLSNFEKEVIYETIMVDCGKSDLQFLQEMQNKHNITKLMVTKYSEGIASNFSAAFFGLCRSQFILTVEEDWDYNGPEDYQAIMMAKELLNAVPKVWGVIVRLDDWYDQTVPNPNIIKNLTRPIQFQRHCYQSSWGAYANGVSLYRFSSMYYRAYKFNIHFMACNAV